MAIHHIIVHFFSVNIGINILINPPTELTILLKDLALVAEENVQSLWSGYGQIIRCKHVTNNKTYIVKLITPNNKTAHPRGWNTSISHQRKVKSYQVEANFYRDFSYLTDANCKVPTLITTKISDEFTLLVMEDLDQAGYSKRIKTADWQSLSIAIKWLAYFHAKFMSAIGYSTRHCHTSPVNILAGSMVGIFQ